MVADILEASIRVLKRDGGHRFTTIRVAAQAGVSVGSLYQYFPNKAALLFRLQRDEWRATSQKMAELLSDASVRPVDRLRRTVIEFFRTEVEEAELRRALNDASALFRNSTEARAEQLEARRSARRLFRAVLPKTPGKEVDFLADFFSLSLGAIAEKVTDGAHSEAELRRWAETTADLLCSYFEKLAHPRGEGRGRPHAAGQRALSRFSG